MKTILALLVLCLVARADDITITFSVPKGERDAYIERVASAFGYQPTLSENEQHGSVVAPVERDNPETPEDFCKRTLREMLVAKVRDAAKSEAVAAASKQAEEAVEAASKESADKVTVK
jgi:hypothetical protein